MKLGQKVSFSKSLSKQSGYYVDYANLSKEQSQQLENDGFITLKRYKEREHNEKEGFVCGKRFITSVGLLEEVEDPYRGWHLVQTDGTHEEVYVVACDMRGLYRVRAEDLEVVP